MIANLKARLRAWLIDLVREAIRIERTAELLNKHPTRFVGTMAPRMAPVPMSYSDALSQAAAAPQVIPFEPSFEQLQSEALQAQEKYYEPKRA
jgi:hypothetical protein